MGDLIAVLVVFFYGIGAALVLLVPRRTRRAAGWLLLGTLLIPAGCFGPAEVRDALVARPR